jgi:hypothetical protein
MASHFLSGCEAVNIRLNEVPKGPLRKLSVSFWPDSNENRVHDLERGGLTRRSRKNRPKTCGRPVPRRTDGAGGRLCAVLHRLPEFRHASWPSQATSLRRLRP